MTSGVDPQLIELDARVAGLADAWLDVRDDDVLRRARLTVAARRSNLHPSAAASERAPCLWELDTRVSLSDFAYRGGENLGGSAPAEDAAGTVVEAAG